MQKTGIGTAGLGRVHRSAMELVRAREFAIFGFLLVVIAILGVVSPTFFSISNFLEMGRQMAEVAIMGVAMTFVLTAQELDLSVGSVYGLCSMTMALLTKNFGIDLWLSLLAALLIAAAIGLVNGVLVTRGRVPSFIVTLGMLSVLRGVTLVLSIWPVSRLENPTFYRVLAGEVGGIPVQDIWMLGIVVTGALVLRKTTFGYHVRATGSNRAAAELSGIPVNRVKVLALVFSAVAAAFAGALAFAHLTSVSPVAGTGTELTVIAGVVIGGTALFGGQGTIVGTFLGTALLFVIRNGLVQIGGEGRLQDAFLGGIIILAVLIHTHVGRKRR